MEEKILMMDYRTDKQDIVRVAIDDMEFCVKDGITHFTVNGRKYHIPLENVIQVYTNNT